MLYLDSAIVSEAEKVRSWGWVKGITTNPTLLKKSPLSPEETLEKLRDLSAGELYYQIVSPDFEGMVREGKRAFEIIGEKTVLKIPATEIGFRAVARLSPTITCSVTAIYHPAQAIIAREAGAKYAIAYVNRATRLLGDGLELVRRMKTVLKGSGTEILAASIKSPEEAAASIEAGADHLTLPLDILQAMTGHELSDRTVEEFNLNGKGLSVSDS